MLIQLNAGKKFNKLTVIRQVTFKSPIKFLCKCDCGKEAVVRSGLLRRGGTKSCGCAKKGINLKHGHCLNKNQVSKTYSSWCDMKQRCQGAQARDNYKGRGIKVCERWQWFENFLKDMGEVPVGHTIERREVDGDYCKDNCLWIPKARQSGNRTNTRWVTLDGEVMCLRQAAAKLGFEDATLRRRMSVYGYTPKMDVRIISYPLNGG